MKEIPISSKGKLFLKDAFQESVHTGLIAKLNPNHVTKLCIIRPARYRITVSIFARGRENPFGRLSGHTGRM